jgi:hypothetical protein
MSVNYKKYDAECILQYHQNLVIWLHSKLSYTLHGSVYIILLSCLPAPAIKRYCIIFSGKQIRLYWYCQFLHKIKQKQNKSDIKFHKSKEWNQGFQTGQLPLTPVPLMTPSPNSYDQLRKYRFSNTFWGKKLDSMETLHIQYNPDFYVNIRILSTR